MVVDAEARSISQSNLKCEDETKLREYAGGTVNWEKRKKHTER